MYQCPRDKPTAPLFALRNQQVSSYIMNGAVNQTFLAVSRWRLTRREEEVLLCLCRYGPEKDVADALGISRHTAHVHVARIFQKLVLHDRKTAVRKFLKTLPGGVGLESTSSHGIT